MEDWLLPLGTFILGQLFALVLGWRQAAWQRDRDREGRQEERRERAWEWQRETLLELQEALYQLGLQSYFLAQVVWDDATHALYDESARLEAFARAGFLRVRVPDSELRELAGRVRDRANEVRSATTREDAQKALQLQGDEYQRANERVGQILRGEVANDVRGQ